MEAKKEISGRALAAMATISSITGLLSDSAWARSKDTPGVCDLMVANPHDMPNPAFVAAVRRWSEPKEPGWFSYIRNEPAARAAAAEGLIKWRGEAFKPEDIFLTTGASAGIAVVLGTIVDPGDEVIFISPPWFQYEGMIVMAGGLPVRVKADREKNFDLDPAVIERAITAKTRAVIVNSPHNPTGRIYPEETLRGLGNILDEASARNGRRIFLISDESYSRFVFDGHTYLSPTSCYPDSFLIYTYSKTLLIPGERIGYIALPPAMAEKEPIRAALQAMQMLIGWAFPNSVLQRALGDIEKIPFDMMPIQRRLDRMVPALRGMGYELSPPEGTCYLLVRSPLADDRAFTGLLDARDVFCIPGHLMDIPGYFRISLTATDEMIERSLPRFAEAMELAAGRNG